ncbi:unnamed protein product [Sphagnum troendelagicum]|uniref:EGF-like domain-containing protein n=1 Tax=Sphagnum troendelagicum TaxID=128251 RepID=A0ABP0U1A7_9BRYO
MRHKKKHEPKILALYLMMIRFVIFQTSISGFLNVENSKDSAEYDDPLSSSVVNALNYPNLKVGPYNWKYFQVEVVDAFSVFKIELSRNWMVAKEDNWIETKVPLICFRLGGPPLPNTIWETIEEAAMATGRVQNVSGKGQCAWFHNSTLIYLSNMQVVAGVWYIGVFSNSNPSRFQSKMISRGKTFTFGLHVIVLKCNSPILRGPNCNITVTQLCSNLPIDHLYTTSWHPSDGSLHEELKHHDLKPLSGSSIQDHSAFLNDANWVVLKDQNIQPGEWKYYSLDVPQYYLKLDIITVVSPMAFKSDMGLNKLYQSTRYGALPEQSQDQMHLSLNALTIDVPKHGLWYIGVFNPVGEDFMGMINFNLYWRLESCNTKTQGAECKPTLIPLERKLMETAYESPFDSYYTLIGKPVSYFQWVPVEILNCLKSLPIALNNNTCHENWTYFLIVVPKGTSGAVLSIQLRHTWTSITDVYIRFEGIPTNEIWDFSTTTLEFQSSNVFERRKQSLDVVFPIEGMWCLGVQSQINDNSTLEKDTNTNGGAHIQVTIHGCLNGCSGHGSCQTTNEASQLHFFSYCHCDATHGGHDCSLLLLLPFEQMVHIWALVGSNLAAILPSMWAFHHHAYSEWVTYTLSGVTSAIYHSCDAGGWCALSYDTLQFLDFWLSFLAVVMTCVYIASFAHSIKGAFQMGATIIAAAFTKENATSAWNVLLVVLIGMAGLVIGWAMECWHLQHRIPSWLQISTMAPLRGVLRVWEAMHRQAEEFLGKMRGRFHWVYLIVGLTILTLAGLSWLLETDDTYWIWHSLWHVCIYTSAFVILSSTSSYPTWSSQGQPHSHYLGHHQRLVSTMPYNYDDGEDESLDPESRHNNVSLCQM